MAEWLTACTEELQTFRWMEVYEEVDQPHDHKIISSKWVFRIKRGPDGKIQKYKAHLVTKGFTQVEGIDYDETFAPVMKFSSLRTVLALTAKHNLKVHQMDVKATYFNGILEEEIYLEPPTGFKPGNVKVWQLDKSIYSMWQGGRVWYKRIKEEFKALGYVRSNVNHSVFLKYDDTSQLICIVAIYIDDITLTSDSLEEITKAKEALNLTFDMTDLGKIGWILGMQVIQDRPCKMITVSQERYIHDILEKHGQQNACPMATPSLPNEQLEKLKEPEPDINVHQYQSAVGTLMYAMLGTCPDLAYTVSILSQHTTTLGKAHVHVLNCAFQYLQATAHHTLHFDGNEPGKLTSFIDADWAANINDRHSISGYMFMMSGCTISWSSKKQGSVALSSTKAEYIAGA